MCLGIENELVRGTVARHLENAVLIYESASTYGCGYLFFEGTTHWRMYQIRVLHHLCEQEALLHILK